MDKRGQANMDTHQSTHETGERFVRQLLLHRYKMLLDKIGKTYPLTEQQKHALEEKILNIHWIDTALP
jgi:hypothetical protein